jgi:hypothetical protein
MWFMLLTFFKIRSCSWYRFGNHVLRSWRARLPVSSRTLKVHGRRRLQWPLRNMKNVLLAYLLMIGWQFNVKEVREDKSHSGWSVIPKTDARSPSQT